VAADLLDWEVDGSPSAGSLPRVPGLLSGGIQLNISPDYANAAGFWAPILIVLGAAITIAGLALQSSEYMPYPEDFHNKTWNAISACLWPIASHVCFRLFKIADRRVVSCFVLFPNILQLRAPHSEQSCVVSFVTTKPDQREG
jgi:hypothetical protein